MSNNLHKDLLKCDKSPKNLHEMINPELWRWHELLKAVKTNKQTNPQILASLAREKKKKQAKLYFWFF